MSVPAKMAVAEGCATRMFTDRDNLRTARRAPVDRAVAEKFGGGCVINCYGLGGIGKATAANQAPRRGARTRGAIPLTGTSR